MSTNELRQRFIDYYKQKDHLDIPSYPIVPKDDPTTLFVSSGMQPMLPYFLGEPHPSGKTRVVDSQKCFRAVDIEEVGDNRHTTFFEMLGNWSFGDYWKEEQLCWIFSFLVDELKMDPQKLYVTVFDGDEENGIPRDEESAEIWHKLFLERGMDARVGERILYYGNKKNWWSREGTPAEMSVGEPGGPDSEIFYEFDSVKHDPKFGESCHVNCDCGRYMEICNSVFMQYKKVGDGKFEPLPKMNVDFGAGLERVAAALNNNPDVFTIDFFTPLIQAISADTGKSYAAENMAPMRIIADHLRAATMMILEGVVPANKLAGYVLRRLIRRSAVKYRELGGTDFSKLPQICNTVLKTYALDTAENIALVEKAVTEETSKFGKAIEAGMREIEKAPADMITGEFVFNLYQSYGFPFEITKEILAKKGIQVDQTAFEEAKKQHQMKS